MVIASIKTKMHAISPDVTAGLSMAVDLAEKDYQGVVIWSGDEPFSAGADLQAMLPGFMMGGVAAIDEVEAELQRVMLKLRYASVPVVSAIRGLALGGGCEVAVYSARRVVHMESYIGLVEVGVGLVPGAGGLTYIARRAAENAEPSTGKDLLPFLTEGFTAAAMAKVGTSALESRKLGYLLDSDLIVPQQGRAAVRGPQRGPGHVQGGLPRAAQAPVCRGRAAVARPRSRASWSTCATAASSASTTSTSPA